jgi:predicted CXXCH cytochrome family protein
MVTVKKIAFLLSNAIIAVSIAFCLSGCDPIARHKVLSTIFDGVPSLPPPEQVCQEYAEKRIAAEHEAASSKKGADGGKSEKEESRHPPYEAKECDGCHDKSKEGGLAYPRNELCFVCHTNFIKGSFVHGPVAVGDCLACHLPHTAAATSLLKVKRSEICSTCHREKRVAAGMHETLRQQQIACVDCHNPHYGNAMYFLK